MAIYYLDSSAIVKRYVDEPGSRWSGLSLVFIAGDAALLKAAQARRLAVENPHEHANLDQAADR